MTKSSVGVFGLVVAVCALAACTSTSHTSDRGSSQHAPSNATGRSSGASTSVSTAGSTPSASTGTANPSASDDGPDGAPSGGPVPAGFTPTSTTFVSADDGWVLGTAPCSTNPCTSIVRTRDGGRSWVGVPAPKASLGQPDSGRNGEVAVLRFADQQNGWAGVGSLFSTHDAGATWHRQPVPGARGVVSTIETGGGRVYVTVDGCPSQGGNNCARTVQLFSSPIGTDHFTPVTGTLVGGGGPSGLVVHSRYWFLPTTAGIYYGSGPTRQGRSPNPCPTDDGGGARPSVAVADPSHLDAMCVSEGAAGTATYQLYGTTNGGRTWTKAGPARHQASALYGIADNGHGVLLEAVASGGSQIIRTTDDGTTVGDARIHARAGGIGWADLGFTTSSQATVVLQSTTMYLSHDAGRTFTPVHF